MYSKTQKYTDVRRSGKRSSEGVLVVMIVVVVTVAVVEVVVTLGVGTIVVQTA